MYLGARTLDDLLEKVFRELLKSDNRVSPTKGDAREIFGVMLGIQYPRARLSRSDSRGNAISPIGEFLWYMAGSKNLDFIEFYIPGYGKFSDDGISVHGAYGPRLFHSDGINQVEEVVKRLRDKPDSRKAVIQLYRAADLVSGAKDIPCTCTIQFVVRSRALRALVHMRSNDAFLGLPHDVFSFTMLQEYVARELGVGLGSYHHSVGSLHLYDRNFEEAKAYLDEGFQASKNMPPMPRGSQAGAIQGILEFARSLRSGDVQAEIPEILDKYWRDLAVLLKIHALVKFARRESSSASPVTSVRKQIIELKDELNNLDYRIYANKNIDRLIPRKKQLDLNLESNKEGGCER